MSKYEIDIPKGKKVSMVTTCDDHVQVVFEDENKSLKWEDIINNNAKAEWYFVSKYSTIESQIGRCTDINEDGNVVNSEKEAKKILALSKLMIIADAANHEIGWIPEKDEVCYGYTYNKKTNNVDIVSYILNIPNPIIFNRLENAQYAYDVNKDIVDAYFKP